MKTKKSKKNKQVRQTEKERDTVNTVFDLMEVPMCVTVGVTGGVTASLHSQPPYRIWCT